jgi:ubiquinone/menaquinone biosynthesis C-methylase UbiE
MQRVVDEYHSIVSEGLKLQERAGLAHAIAGKSRPRILDLGVGAGRTVEPLREMASAYVGVDYVQPMVDHCRRHFPDVRFEQADARSLTMFADGEFDLVVFSCSGISMVDHEGRLAILKEVRRVLSPGGVFFFSTFNRNSQDYTTFFRFPELQFTANPVKLGVRLLRFGGQTAFRFFNRMKYRRHEVSVPDYAIRNDVYHHYRTMLYYISIDAQRKQLRDAGYVGQPVVFDRNGEIVEKDCSDGTIVFVVHRDA